MIPPRTGHLVLVLGYCATLCAAQPRELPYFVGREVCLSCHAPDGSAAPCSLEPISEHDLAYDALSMAEAGEIAALCGEPTPPQQSRICMGCHATSAEAGPRWTTATFDIRQGVQCEACHHAGSLHISAFSSGIAPAVDPSIRCGDRTTCAECHVDRPSHREVLQSGYRRQEADHRYKTPVSLVCSGDGDLLYVVCEHSSSIMVLRAGTGDVLAEIPVGMRPCAAALSPDGRTLYVTSRMDGMLNVIDTASRRVTGRIAVGAEPHGVRTDSRGDRIFVLNTGEDSLSIIDAGTSAEIARLPTGVGPWSLALHPDRETICITNVRPQFARFQEPFSSELTVVSAGIGAVDRRATVPQANMLQGIAFVPGRDVALFTLMRTKNLVPITRIAQGWTITDGIGVLWPDGRVDQVLLDEPNQAFADPMDIAVSPDGRHALVTSGGDDEVAVVDVSELLGLITNASDHDRREVLPNHLGMSRRFVQRRISVGRNPRGVVFSPDGRYAYVACALDDSITVIDAATFNPLRAHRLGGPTETTTLRLGEQLFHSATKTAGRQFSCRSCHPDGHSNGLSFDIEADGIGLNPADNRSLRGILDTPPFKWEGTNPTLHRQCGPRFAVYFTRQSPFTPEELDAVVHYMATIERPPNPHHAPDGLTPSQLRGKLVFERTTMNSGRLIPVGQRCSTCHNTPYKTARTKAVVGTTMWFDRTVDLDIKNLHDVESFGELGVIYFYDTGAYTKAFDAPHLNNIFDSAPYLHNGASPTLEEIWTRFSLYQLHGFTSDLTRRQFNDLIAYLKSI